MNEISLQDNLPNRFHKGKAVQYFLDEGVFPLCIPVQSWIGGCGHRLETDGLRAGLSGFLFSKYHLKFEESKFITSLIKTVLNHELVFFCNSNALIH